MFLNSDQNKANSLLDQYGHHLHFAIKFMAESDFEAAGKHHEVLTETLEQLAGLKACKQAVDNAASFYQESKNKMTWEEVVNGLKGVL